MRRKRQAPDGIVTAPATLRSGQILFLSVVLLSSKEKSPPNWRWFFFKMVDLIGIEPTTLRMRTVRSPSWAIGPYLVVLYIFAWLICAVCCFGRAGVMLRWLSQLSYRPKSTVPKAEQKNKAIWNYRCGRKLNPLRSQLSYEPKSAIFQSKKLWKTDFWDIRFWGEITENQTSEWEENQRCGM